ncbi:MAG: type II toxin-antitoxin system Phd/YefM family antitoxin [Cocleimonas sp.]
MIKQINIHEAKTHLSRLLESIIEGDEVVIAKHGKPIARLIPFETKPTIRKPGALKGEIKMKDDFDAPLPDDIAESLGLL